MKLSSYTKAVAGASAVLMLLAIGMVVFEGLNSEIPPAPFLNDGKLTDAQKESLTVMLDLAKLLMNWSVAVIGAAGFFLKIGVEKDIPILARDLILTFCIVLLSVASLYLGHLIVDMSSEILSLDQFPVRNHKIRMFGRYQYILGLSSVVLFGLHVFQFFWARKSGKQLPN